MSKSKSNTQIANILEVRHGKPMVSSLKIAELFKRPHFRVLKSIDRLIERGKLTPTPVVSEWIDSTGRSNKLYYLNERQSLIAMPFIGGDQAEDGQIKLVDAYLYYRDRFPDPPRSCILKAKRAANILMNDALLERRQDLKKETAEHHYTNEARLCNWAVTGKFEAIDEKTLSNDDATLLEQVRDRNRSYIQAERDYQERKKMLFEFATRQRTKRLTMGDK